MNFIEANGVGLRYELSGKGERALVLVHEMGGSLESWDDIAPRFAASRRVLRYDTRGAGLSQKARGKLTLDTMADDIAALLDTLAISGKMAIAGIAFGGAIALGHPFGMTGARLITTAIHGLQDQDASIALVSLCVGGDMGMAVVLERLS